MCPKMFFKGKILRKLYFFARKITKSAFLLNKDSKTPEKCQIWLSCQKIFLPARQGQKTPETAKSGRKIWYLAALLLVQKFVISILSC